LNRTNKIKRTTPCVADPEPFDTDPVPAFQCDTDPDPTVWNGSGSLPYQIGFIPKTVFFIHLYLIFLVSSSNRTHKKCTVFFVKFSHPVNFVVPVE
jgi:hypothetical protein